MALIQRGVTRLVDQDDVRGLLSALVDGYALVYDAAAGAFALQRMATHESVFGEPGALTAAGALATLFDAESGGTHDTHFGVYCWCELADGTLLAGIGNRPADNDGALIVRISAAGAVALEKVLDEQGVHDMLLHDGQVYVLGTDAAFGDDWTYGNVYVRSAAGVWTKRRTVPNVLHCLSQCWAASSGGNWYVGTGAHTGDNATWKGYVFKSSDDGATWTRLTAEVCDYRVYNLAYFRSRLYAAGMTQAQYAAGTANIYTSTDDGATWADSGTTIRARARWVEFGGSLWAAGAAATQLVQVAAGGTISTGTLPFTLASSDEYEASVLVATADGLWATGTTGLWFSADGLTWAAVWELAGCATPWVWAAEGRLLASTRGADASVWAGPTLPTLGQLAVGKLAAAEFNAHATDADAHHTWPLTEPDIPAAIARDSEVAAAVAAHDVAVQAAIVQVFSTCNPFVVLDAEGWPVFDDCGALIHAYSDEVVVDAAAEPLVDDYEYMIGA